LAIELLLFAAFLDPLQVVLGYLRDTLKLLIPSIMVVPQLMDWDPFKFIYLFILKAGQRWKLYFVAKQLWKFSAQPHFLSRSGSEEAGAFK